MNICFAENLNKIFKKYKLVDNLPHAAFSILFFFFFISFIL